MKHALLRILASIIPLLSVGFFAMSAKAATVRIQAPAEVVVGQTFQVRYTVLDAKAIDTVRLIGQYTPALLSLSTMSPSGQLDSKSPSTAFNQANGTFSYGAFTIAGAMDGSVGAGAFTFKALEKGVATIQLNSGSLVLSSGENQLAGLASAQIRIVDPKATEEVRVQPSSTSSTLVVKSSSHPNQNAWYRDSEVTLQWSAEGNGIASVFIAFNDQPEGPVTEKVSNSGTKTFTAPKDGVWYAHVLVTYVDGRRLRQDYRLQIDATAPKTFALTSDYQNIDATIPNYLRFAALDDTSGIREYRVFEGDTLMATTTNPYFEITGQVGEKNYTVEAIDLADNRTKSSIKLVLGSDYSVAEKSSLTWVLLVGMFLVMLTGFFVGMLLMRRRKEEKEPEKKLIHRTRKK